MSTDLWVIFQFLVTNNVAEYEVLVAGLKMAIKAGLRWLVMHSNSQLVMTKVTGQLQCKDLTLSQYLKLVQNLQQQFGNLEINKISRDQNTRADKLSKERLQSVIERLANPSISSIHAITTMND